MNFYLILSLTWNYHKGSLLLIPILCWPIYSYHTEIKHIYTHTHTILTHYKTLLSCQMWQSSLPHLWSRSNYIADAHSALCLKSSVTSNSLNTTQYVHGNSVYWNCYFWVWFSFILRSINMLLTVLKGPYKN